MSDRHIELLHSDLKIDDLVLVNFVNASDKELDMVREWRNHPDVRVWMYNQNEISWEEHRGFVETLKSAKDRAYWIVKDADKYLGVIYLLNIRTLHGHAYAGLYSDPFKRHKSAGKQLMSAILKLSFDLLKLHTLKLEVFETNERAINLYKKFGFKEEGRLREFVKSNDGWIDVLIMGLVNPKEVDLE